MHILYEVMGTHGGGEQHKIFKALGVGGGTGERMGGKSRSTCAPKSCYVLRGQGTSGCSITRDALNAQTSRALPVLNAVGNRLAGLQLCSPAVSAQPAKACVLADRNFRARTVMDLCDPLLSLARPARSTRG